MEYAPEIVVALIIGLLFLTAIFVAWRLALAEARRTALRRIASQLGLRCERKTTDVRSDRTFLSVKPLIGWADLVISGDIEGLHVEYLDFQDLRSAHSVRKPYWSGVCTLTCPLRFMPLVVRPRDLFDHTAGPLDFEAIELDNAEFNRIYRVASPSRKFAFDILNQRAIALILADTPTLIETDGPRLTFTRPGRLSPDAVESLIEHSLAFYRLVPEYLRADLAGHGENTPQNAPKPAPGNTE